MYATIKQVIHYPETNSVEATWADSEGIVIKCHSYSDRQMDMFLTDLGVAATQEHLNLIELVTLNQAPILPEPVLVPQVITIRQAKLVLLAAGLLDDVDNAVAAADRITQIEWEYATEVHRTWPTLTTLAAILGIDNDALDALFIQGASL